MSSSTLLYEFAARARSPGYLAADGIDAMPSKPLKNKGLRAAVAFSVGEWRRP